jgi:hypothetical protein
MRGIDLPCKRRERAALRGRETLRVRRTDAACVITGV